MSAQRNSYIYGTAVRKPEYTSYGREPARRRPAAGQARRSRRRSRRNTGAGYTLFLLAAAMVILLVRMISERPSALRRRSVSPVRKRKSVICRAH